VWELLQLSGRLGKDLGELIGLDGKLGIEVTSSLLDILEKKKADVVFDATRNLIKDIQESLFTSVKAGLTFFPSVRNWHTPGMNTNNWRPKSIIWPRPTQSLSWRQVLIQGCRRFVALIFTAPCKKVRSITGIRTTNASGLGPSALGH